MIRWIVKIGNSVITTSAGVLKKKKIQLNGADEKSAPRAFILILLY